MAKRAGVALGLVSALWTAVPAGATPITYSYTGNAMNYAGGLFDQVPNGLSYSTTMFITGAFTVDDSLLGGAVLTDIAAGVTALSFSDGLQTLTQATATDIFVVSIAVDGSNQIIAWEILLKTPYPSAAGGTFSYMTTRNHSGFATDVGQIAQCVSLAPCQPPLVDQAQSLQNPGVWTMTQGSGPVVPEPATVWLVGIGLTAASGWRRFRSNPNLR
jgi:hypothetical protein